MRRTEFDDVVLPGRDTEAYELRPFVPVQPPKATTKDKSIPIRRPAFGYMKIRDVPLPNHQRNNRTITYTMPKWRVEDARRKFGISHAEWLRITAHPKPRDYQAILLRIKVADELYKPDPVTKIMPSLHEVAAAMNTCSHTTVLGWVRMARTKEKR